MSSDELGCRHHSVICWNSPGKPDSTCCWRAAARSDSESYGPQAGALVL